MGAPLGVDIEEVDLVCALMSGDPDGIARCIVRRSDGAPGVLDPIRRCGVCVWCTRGLGEHCAQREITTESDVRGRMQIQKSCFVTIDPSSPVELAVHAWAAGVAGTLADRLRGFGGSFQSLLADDPTEDVDGLVALRVLSDRLPKLRCLTVSPRVEELCTRWKVAHRSLGEVGVRGDQDVVIDARRKQSKGGEGALGMVRPRGTLAVLGRRGGVVDVAALMDREIELECVWTGSVSRGVDELLSLDAIEDLGRLATNRAEISSDQAAMEVSTDTSVTLVSGPGGSR